MARLCIPWRWLARLVAKVTGWYPRDQLGRIMENRMTRRLENRETDAEQKKALSYNIGLGKHTPQSILV